MAPRAPARVVDPEQLCQQIIASAQEGIFVLDRNLRLTLWNRFMEELTGQRAEAVAGRPLLEVLPALREHAGEPLLRRALAGERVIVPDLLSTPSSRGGAPVWVALRLGPLCEAGGGVTGVLGSLRDITERKQADAGLAKSEERFRSLIELAVDAIFLQDSQGHFLEANSRACELTGHARAELLRMSMRQMFSEEELRRHPLRTDLLREGGTVTFRRTLTCKAGRPVPVEMNSKMMPDGTIQTFMRDISERERANQALQEALRRFENVLQSAPLVAIQGFDRDGVVQHWNEAAHRLYGLSAEQALGRPVQELLFSDEEPAEFERLLDRVWTTGQSTSAWERQIAPAQGEPRWVYSAMFPVSERGQVVEVFCMDVDITERKRAGEALGDSEAKLRSIINSLPYPIFSKDALLRYSECNRAFLQFFGKKREDIIGKTVFDLGPKDYAEVSHRADLELMESGGFQSYELVVPGPDQSNRNLIVHKGAYFDGEGRIAGMVGILLDITERKRAEQALLESEERFRRIFEDGPLGMATSGPDLRILRANAAFCRMLGRTEEELTALTFKQVTHPEHVGHDTEHVQKLFRGEIPMYRTEKRYLRKDQGIRWGAVTVSAIRDPQGKFLYFLAMIEDITERKELETRLRQAQKLEGVGQLAGGVAHDFNNILTVILGNVSVLLAQPDLRTETADLLRQVSEAAERAAHLTRQLLAFSRKQPMKIERLDLNEVVSGLAKMLRRLIGEDIELEFRQGSGLLPVRGDAGMIGQVLLNLAINARDVMPQGGRLVLSTHLVTLDPAQAQRHPTAQEGRFIRLDVQDTGPGIAPEILPRIFEPFFTTKDVGKGTGLGLATAYGIARQHGGWIDVETLQGVGTTFRLFLPVDETDAPLTVERPVSPPLAAGHETILVVEDEPSVRKLVRTCLELSGYHVFDAANAREAMERWEQHHGAVDLLLTDLVMPGGMGGRELAVRLRSQKFGLKVVYSSGYSVHLPEEEELETGSVFLPKPYEMSTLTKVVRDCLDAK